MSHLFLRQELEFPKQTDNISSRISFGLLFLENAHFFLLKETQQNAVNFKGWEEGTRPSHCKPKLLVVRIFSFQICGVSCDEQKILSIGMAVLLFPAERYKIKDKSVI